MPLLQTSRSAVCWAGQLDPGGLCKASLSPLGTLQGPWQPGGQSWRERHSPSCCSRGGDPDGHLVLRCPVTEFHVIKGELCAGGDVVRVVSCPGHRALHAVGTQYIRNVGSPSIDLFFYKKKTRWTPAGQHLISESAPEAEERPQRPVWHFGCKSPSLLTGVRELPVVVTELVSVD